MKSIFTYVSAAVALVDVVSAHYRFTSLIVNGQKTADYLYVRENTNYNSPVTSLSSNDIRCNTGTSGAGTSTATVAAGSTIGFALDQSIYHPGPLQIYISKSTTADVKTYDGSGPWAKLASITATFSSGSVTWTASNLAQYTFTLPSSLAPGQYLLRAEHIALHVAQSTGGAQFYISCAQIEVTGSGSATPSPTIQLPGGYSANDPGILFNLNYPIPTAYTAPGPAVWRG